MAVQTLQRTSEYESVNPFDGKSFKTFVETTDAQLEAKIAAAQACYETWRHKTYAERAVVVSKAAELSHG
jgi:succinate-semialdehyde dehydrogenase/glutarate-semialdehyde dehydrogenase